MERKANKSRPVALITGAGRGIGRGIAIQLAKNGFDIVGNDVQYNPEDKKTGLFEVNDRVEELGGSFLPVRGDISDLSIHESMLNQALTEFGRINVLVNNAGVAPEKRADILKTSPESYDRVLSVNARGPFFLTQRIAGHMIQQVRQHSEKKPCIVFISSISATVSSTTRAEYCISKAALSQTAALFADRLSEYGINVYEIRPGIIKIRQAHLRRSRPAETMGLSRRYWKSSSGVGQGVFRLRHRPRPRNQRGNEYQKIVVLLGTS
jgi:3-oxoacyl-[acyl-carrier protein] reductase